MRHHLSIEDPVALAAEVAAVGEHEQTQRWSHGCVRSLAFARLMELGKDQQGDRKSVV